MPASVASTVIVNVTSFTLLDALAELADAAALAALLLAAVLDAVDAALAEAFAELADELAAELEACWPQPASAIAIASANAIASTEKSFEFRFIYPPLVVGILPNALMRCQHYNASAHRKNDCCSFKLFMSCEARRP